MLILQPHIFKKFKDLEFGFSTRIGDNETGPYCFNLSLSVGDDKERVLKNRNKFFNALGLSFESAVIQKQVHGDKINYVTKPGNAGESDALVTDKPGLTLCISTADCTPIFIYDQKIKIIAAVHSGWRGTQKKILHKKSPH